MVVRGSLDEGPVPGFTEDTTVARDDRTKSSSETSTSKSTTAKVPTVLGPVVVSHPILITEEDETSDTAEVDGQRNTAIAPPSRNNGKSRPSLTSSSTRRRLGNGFVAGLGAALGNVGAMVGPLATLPLRIVKRVIHLRPFTDPAYAQRLIFLVLARSTPMSTLFAPLAYASLQRWALGFLVQGASGSLASVPGISTVLAPIRVLLALPGRAPLALRAPMEALDRALTELGEAQIVVIVASMVYERVLKDHLPWITFSGYRPRAQVEGSLPERERTAGPLRRTTSIGSEMSCVSNASRPSTYRGPKHAEEARHFREQLQELKRILAKKGIVLPADRFGEDDAELFRFANASGLAAAVQRQRPRDVERAIAGGAKQCEEAVNWRASYPFLSDEALLPWKRYVQWSGRDKEGRPALFISLGSFLVPSRGPSGAESPAVTPQMKAELVRAIVTQVENGVNRWLKNSPGRAEQLVVVLWCNNLGILRTAASIGTVQELAITLTKNYPSRLGKLFVVELPQVLSYTLKAVKQALPPVTREKIFVCDRHHADLPDPPINSKAMVLPQNGAGNGTGMPPRPHLRAPGDESGGGGGSGGRTAPRSTPEPANRLHSASAAAPGTAAVAASALSLTTGKAASRRVSVTFESAPQSPVRAPEARQAAGFRSLQPKPLRMRAALKAPEELNSAMSPPSRLGLIERMDSWSSSMGGALSPASTAVNERDTLEMTWYPIGGAGDSSSLSSMSERKMLEVMFGLVAFAVAILNSLRYSVLGGAPAPQRSAKS